MKKSPVNQKISSSIAGLGVLSALVSGCDTTDILTSNFLKVDARVVAQDGVTPYPGLPIDNYRWVVTYRDGSTVSMPFDQPLVTDINGRFGFSSGELQLKSGNPVLRGCTDVCVERSGYYETACILEETYENEYCEYWYYDEYGFEQCGSWRTEYITQCAQYGERYVSFCSVWAEDCDYTYPDRDVDDIAYSVSEIDYRRNGSVITTSSSGANSSSYADLDDRASRRTLQWLETPTFVLPFPAVQLSQQSSALVAAPSERQKQLTAARNANRKSRTRRVEVPAVSARPAARHVRYEELAKLNGSQTRALKQARQCFEVSQRK